MSLLDPEIIEARLRNIFLNQPEQIGFDYLAELIRHSPFSTEAHRELIAAVRVFVRLQGDVFFQSRCRSFYN